MADPRSADEMVKRVTQDQDLMEQVKANPAIALQKLANQVVRDMPPALQMPPDVWIYRIVVSVLGIAVLMALAGAIALQFKSANIPETLTALGSAAVGALAGLLAPSPAQQKK